MLDPSVDRAWHCAPCGGRACSDAQQKYPHQTVHPSIIVEGASGGPITQGAAFDFASSHL